MTIVARNDIETQHDLEGLPRHLTLSSTSKTYQMRVSDTVMVITGDTGADDDGIVTLPSLAEAAGKFYYVVAPTGAAGDAVLLFEKETGAVYATNGLLDADDDHIILFSDGSKWRTVLDGVA